jgi:cytochrome c553
VVRRLPQHESPSHGTLHNMSLLFRLLFLGLTASSALAQPVPDSLGQRALACTGCHGKEGRAAPDGYYPRLAGKPEGYLYRRAISTTSC